MNFWVTPSLSKGGLNYRNISFLTIDSDIVQGEIISVTLFILRDPRSAQLSTITIKTFRVESTFPRSSSIDLWLKMLENQ